MAGARVSCLRFLFVLQGRFEVFVSDLQRVAAIATMTKTANGNSWWRAAGSWELDDYRHVSGCLWDGRCSFGTKLDGLGRAFRQTRARVPWFCSLATDTPYYSGAMHPHMEGRQRWRSTVTTHYFWAAPGYFKCRKKQEKLKGGPAGAGW